MTDRPSLPAHLGRLAPELGRQLGPGEPFRLPAFVEDAAHPRHIPAPARVWATRRESRGPHIADEPGEEVVGLLAVWESGEPLGPEPPVEIQREAQRIGSQLGFKVVFSNVMAANGGYDMTNDLIHDVESLHE